MPYKSIAATIKDNRRLATFSIDKPQEFVIYLKTRYDSELENWLYICSSDDWKYPFLATEQKIRKAERRLRYLKELAEVW